MADTHETIADIIAEKRRRADELEASSYRPHQFLRERIAELRQEANRLEAAHKRELSKNTSKNGVDFGQLGDAAKLRDALEATNKFLESAIINGKVTAQDITDLRNIVSAALAAPPRNCDLPEVAKDPWRAWLDDKSNWDEFGSPKLEIHDWLLAPATEKEGGNDAD